MVFTLIFKLLLFVVKILSNNMIIFTILFKKKGKL